MHHARDSPVEKTVTRFECWYENGTSCIVFSAAGVGYAKAAQIGVFGSAVTTAAPLRSWHHEQISSSSAPTLFPIVSIARRSRVLPVHVLQNKFLFIYLSIETAPFPFAAIKAAIILYRLLCRLCRLDRIEIRGDGRVGKRVVAK